MSRVCELTGKKVMTGNNVSHAKNRDDDEIVVQYDEGSVTKKVLRYIHRTQTQENIRGRIKVKVIGFPLNGHFANFKNNLKENCNGDYIFQIDADELPNIVLLQNLPRIFEANPDNEVFLVPRVNTVKGLTNEHISKWNWRLNDEGWVNWPDYQWRIWKNTKQIKWINNIIPIY